MMERVPPGTAAAPAEVERLRHEVARLAEEKAWLETQLRDAGRQPLPVGAPRVTPRRRWIGRAISAGLLVLGFGLGAWYGREFGADVVEGFRDSYDPGTTPAMEAPAAPAAGTPVAPERPPLPAPTRAPVAPAPATPP